MQSACREEQTAQDGNAVGPGGTALGVTTGNRPCLHALIWSYKVTSSSPLTRSLVCSSREYLLYNTISAAPQSRTSSRHGQSGWIPSGEGCPEAERWEGASSGSVTLIFTLSVPELWKPEKALPMLLKERLGYSDEQGHSSSCSAQLLCPMGRCIDFSSPSRLLLIFISPLPWHKPLH